MQYRYITGCDVDGGSKTSAGNSDGICTCSCDIDCCDVDGGSKTGGRVDSVGKGDGNGGVI